MELLWSTTPLARRFHLVLVQILRHVLIGRRLIRQVVDRMIIRRIARTEASVRRQFAGNICLIKDTTHLLGALSTSRIHVTHLGRCIRFVTEKTLSTKENTMINYE